MVEAIMREENSRNYGIKDFVKWVGEIQQAGCLDNVIVNRHEAMPEEKRLTLEFDTATHRYQLSAMESTSGKSYLGCIMSCRAPLPGEAHIRCSDLPDGQLCPETWSLILSAIIAQEMLPIDWKTIAFLPLATERGKTRFSDIYNNYIEGTCMKAGFI